MRIEKAEIVSRYLANKNSAEEILVTGEAARLLRGLLRLTPLKMVALSSLQKNRLLAYENGENLSLRNRRWLQSAFETAGATFVRGQHKIQVNLGDQPVIVNGEIHEDLLDLPYGDDCREGRYAYGWSQKDLAKISGVAQCCISAIENRKPQKFYIADQVAIKLAFTYGD